MLIFVFIFLLIYLVNRWIEIQVGELPDNQKMSYQEKVDFLKNKFLGPKRYQSKGEVLRYQKLEPNRTFAESRFLLNKKEIASFRSKGEKVYDVRGEIPDGKVRFINESTHTKGEEMYRYGRRNGRYLEYYDNGQLYREAQYYKGKLMLNKVYFYDGHLRMEEDRRDALIAVNDREAGKGKVYARDGTLMYEWELTNALNGGYKMSYDKKGDLVEIKYYNTLGKLTEVKKFTTP